MLIFKWKQNKSDNTDGEKSRYSNKTQFNVLYALYDNIEYRWKKRKQLTKNWYRYISQTEVAYMIRTETKNFCKVILK